MIRRDNLQIDHTKEAIALRLAAATKRSYLGDFVLGALDGGVTTFAIVAGAAGAGLSNGVTLVLGLANVLPTDSAWRPATTCALVLTSKYSHSFGQWRRCTSNEFPRESVEVRQILRAKGFEGDVLEQIVRVITEDRQQWVNTMLQEEWGLPLQPAVPWKAGFVTLSAFVLAGLVPLLPVLGWLGGIAAESFWISAVLTGMTFFGVGFIRGRTVNQQPLWAAVETLCLGGLAAALAFGVGRLLEDLATH